MTLNFFLPTKVESGIGLSESIGRVFKSYEANHVLIVTDSGVIHAGLLDRIEDALKMSRINYSLFDEVEPNPSAESIMRGTDKIREFGCDYVLAFGGGSSIDTAKGIAAMRTNPGHILDYEGVGKIKHPPLPVVAIPTTAGTGSEVTASTIITNTQTQFKAAIISPFLFPKLAILDPLLTENLPPHITAATGMDALTHAIESYTSKQANSVSQALAISAIRLIHQHLLNTYYVGSGLKSRQGMLEAAMMAGAAFAQSRLGNVHAISHTFGGVFNIPHGIANAALLPFVLKFNLPACPDKMKDIAAALGQPVDGMSLQEAGEKTIEEVVRLNTAMNIPLNIKELGVSLDKMEKLAEDAMRSGNVLVNPRLTTSQDIRKIIENAYYGILG